MIHITQYQVVNGTKSKPYFVDETFDNEKELETYRRKLEKKHWCYKKIERTFGQPPIFEKIKDILFMKTEIK